MEYFNGHFWEKTSLREIGFVVQLGHSGGACPFTKVTKDVVLLTVLDCNGVHEVLVMFCECGENVGVYGSEVNQLIRAGWYPATKDRPRTVASFNLLEEFDAIAFEGKLSSYHFYKSLLRISDPTECMELPVSNFERPLNQITY